MKILIIEDDAAIVANLYKFLEKVGYHPDLAPRRSAGTSAFLNIAVGRNFARSVVPAVDGLTICRKRREKALCDMQILMLTARDTLKDKLREFGKGVDDDLIRQLNDRSTVIHMRPAPKGRGRPLGAGGHADRNARAVVSSVCRLASNCQIH
ncbi:Response regulator receiver domain-containing protein [Burkholderia sp. OK233]|nr:Response regulator receiver domain-containing protein [Burkholderia sp. OK233]